MVAASIAPRHREHHRHPCRSVAAGRVHCGIEHVPVGRNHLETPLVGDDLYFDKHEDSTNDFNADARRISEEYCFGEIWERPGLPRKTRSMLCLAMLTALNRGTELRAHVNGALNNGCTVQEIKEVLLQSSIYCGLPAHPRAPKRSSAHAGSPTAEQSAGRARSRRRGQRLGRPAQRDREQPGQRRCDRQAQEQGTIASEQVAHMAG